MRVHARLVALALFVVPANAFALPTHGGNGGAPYYLDCGADGMLIDVGWSYATTVASIDGTCVKLGPSGAWASQFYAAGRAGGDASSYKLASCRGGSPTRAVTKIFGRSGSEVDQLAFSCSDTTVENGIVKSTGISSGGFPAGGTGGAPFEDTCPTGQVARGIRGRAGARIDQVELVCHNPTTASGTAVQLASTGIVGVSSTFTAKSTYSTTKKDVIQLDGPKLTTTGPDPGHTSVTPGTYFVGQATRVDIQFTLKNLSWNGNYATSIGKVPYVVRIDGSVVSTAEFSNLQQFTTQVMTLGMSGYRLTDGRHVVEIEMDPNNTLGEDSESRKNNTAKWTVQVEKAIAFRIKSVEIVDGALRAGSTSNRVRITVQSDRAQATVFKYRFFAALVTSADSTSMRNGPASNGNCSVEVEQLLKHGETVIERTFGRCANSGDARKVGVVLDPANEWGESNIADNEWMTTVTWQ